MPSQKLTFITWNIFDISYVFQKNKNTQITIISRLGEKRNIM